MLGRKEELIFLGRDFSEQKNYSEMMAAKIDAEIEKIILGSLEKARKILKEHPDKLDLIAETLVKNETIEGEEFEALMKK